MDICDHRNNETLYKKTRRHKPVQKICYINMQVFNTILSLVCDGQKCTNLLVTVDHYILLYSHENQKTNQQSV